MLLFNPKHVCQGELRIRHIFHTCTEPARELMRHQLPLDLTMCNDTLPLDRHGLDSAAVVPASANTVTSCDGEIIYVKTVIFQVSSTRFVSFLRL